jgi:prepilin-type processing-associated H-X9-DG protein
LLRFPVGSPPFDPAVAPDTIVLKAGRARLQLTWRQGEAADVSASRLRAACRCAWCTRARIDGTFARFFDDTTIEELKPIGDYAVNIAFSDGHARGIYPWSYLRALALDGDSSAPAFPARNQQYEPSA